MNNFLTCVFVLLFLNAYSKDQWVILEWKFKGIEEGFDHLNRSRVSVDGTFLPVSGSCRQSDWGSYSLKLSRTKHTIKFINEAFYEGKWIEHTFENKFSINAICEFDLDVKEVSKVQIEFDLDGSDISIVQFDLNGKALVEREKKTTFKGKHYPMEIDWRFTNVESGYNHVSRMQVFVDDVEYGTSEQSVESMGGKFLLKIPKGMHRIRIVNQSLIDGDWQDHTIVNNYSVEAVYEKLIEVKKNVRVTLVIDLNDEETVNKWEL